MGRSIEADVRFWRFVPDRPDEGCWLWTGAKDRHGYGLFMWTATRRVFAHRAVLMLSGGAIPERYGVCHRCDTPPCVNPAHLFLGDQGANIADAIEKGRIRFPKARAGTSNPSSKLNDEIVRDIRRRVAAGEPQTVIARSLKVDHKCVNFIVNGKTWRHVV